MGCDHAIMHGSRMVRVCPILRVARVMQRTVHSRVVEGTAQRVMKGAAHRMWVHGAKRIPWVVNRALGMRMR